VSNKRSRDDSGADEPAGKKSRPLGPGEYYIFRLELHNWNYLVREVRIEDLVKGARGRMTHNGQVRNVYWPACTARQFAGKVGIAKNNCQHLPEVIRNNGQGRRKHTQGWCGGLAALPDSPTSLTCNTKEEVRSTTTRGMDPFTTTSDEYFKNEYGRMPQDIWPKVSTPGPTIFENWFETLSDVETVHAQAAWALAVEQQLQEPSSGL